MISSEISTRFLHLLAYYLIKVFYFQFEDLFVAVSNNLTTALSCGHTGIIWSFVQACNNLNSHQSRCLKVKHLGT